MSRMAIGVQVSMSSTAGVDIGSGFDTRMMIVEPDESAVPAVLAGQTGLRDLLARWM